jgi:undecaprenyl-diphosphatase
MNLKFQLTQAFFLSLLSAVAFGITAFLVSVHRVAQFDSAIIWFIQSFENPTLTSFMQFISFIGSGRVVFLPSIFVLFFLYKVLKHQEGLFDSERPSSLYVTCIVIQLDLSYNIIN